MLSQQREKLIYLIYNKGIALKELYTNEKTNYRRFRLFFIYISHLSIPKKHFWDDRLEDFDKKPKHGGETQKKFELGSDPGCGGGN